MEPFRSTAPDWRERTDQRLALAERLVAQAGRAPVAAPSVVGAALTGPVRAGADRVLVPRAGPVPAPPAQVPLPVQPAPSTTSGTTTGTTERRRT